MAAADSSSLQLANYNNFVERMTTGNMNKVYMSDSIMVPALWYTYHGTNHSLPVSLRDFHLRNQNLEQIYLLWMVSVGRTTPKTLDNGVCYLQIPKTGSSSTKYELGNFRPTTPEDKCTFVFATIRDPLERFMSGWGTVSHRGKIDSTDWNEDINNAIDKMNAWLVTESEPIDVMVWGHLLPMHYFLSLVPPQTTLVLGDVASVDSRLISFEKGLDITHIEHDTPVGNKNEGGLNRSNAMFSSDVVEKLITYCALDALLMKAHMSYTGTE